jgi:hypothetical protein
MILGGSGRTEFDPPEAGEQTVNGVKTWSRTGLKRMSTPDENAAVEFHDSRVDRIRWHGADCTIVLDGYVHRSPGTPGVSAGSGWSQTVLMHCVHGHVQQGAGKLPIWLSGGRVASASGVLRNLIPVPHFFAGPVRCDLEGFEGEHVVVEAESVEFVLEGDPVYVEEFPG